MNETMTSNRKPGRPCFGDRPKKRITLRLDQGVVARFRAVAKANKKTQATAAEEALTKYSDDTTAPTVA